MKIIPMKILIISINSKEALQVTQFLKNKHRHFTIQLLYVIVNTTRN